MNYKLVDLLYPDRTITEADSIADLWPEIDKQHFMAKTGLVIVNTENDEIVAGEAHLLDRMVSASKYKLNEVAKL